MTGKNYNGKLTDVCGVTAVHYSGYSIHSIPTFTVVYAGGAFGVPVVVESRALVNWVPLGLGWWCVSYRCTLYIYLGTVPLVVIVSLFQGLGTLQGLGGKNTAKRQQSLDEIWRNIRARDRFTSISLPPGRIHCGSQITAH
jgi:hypothetical protein